MLSTQDLQDLQALLAWWRERQRYAQEPSAKLARVTYHVAPEWIEAVKREADLTHESYAAIVNRAFAQYFAQRFT
jgi:predicted DNA binding CopG/RHH family protein